MRSLPLITLLVCTAAEAKPIAPGMFCAQYPNAPVCTGGQPSCVYCHTAPPNRNLFGAAIEAHAGLTTPISDDQFRAAFPAALAAVQEEDSDLDGVTNVMEITLGTLPADGKSFPQGLSCVGKDNPQYKVCEFDSTYAYRKLKLDFCGRSPNVDERAHFAGLDDAGKLAELDVALDACLKSEFWRGKNGQIWQLAHKKIRPVGSLNAGPEDIGDIPIGAYYDDYALFAWSQIDDHDARDVLTADFFVTRFGATYSKVDTLITQRIVKERRAGNLTSSWMLAYFVMFTPVPRNIAAQTYRAYLGLDIAKQEGIYPVAGEPMDYDKKGVTEDTCTQCHATLDPLTYPFRNYNGLAGPLSYWWTYVTNRIQLGFPKQVTATPTLADVPENGVIFNTPVADLRAWAQVAANSDPFVVNIVSDYWRLLMGAPPTAEQNAEFVSLWKRLRGDNGYQVQKMLHELVHTEAYGVP